MSVIGASASAKLAVLWCACVASVASWPVQPGPQHPPTRGEVWPKPKEENKLLDFYTFDTSNFVIKITGHNCSILWKAIHRYSYVLRELKENTDARRRAAGAGRGAEGAPDPHRGGALRELRVRLAQPCEDMPHADMDEAYELSVAAVSQLRTASLWGALRGLETFAQLFYPADDYSAVLVNGTHIRDAPRHSHRGLLLDTSRHYLSPRALHATLAAMELNKMNVLHWHIVDDQSFPYRSDKFPELSEKGAYHPSMVYTGADIAAIVEDARDRGIRVIPEFDVPGHTRSWGAAYPTLLTECYAAGGGGGEAPAALGPMHPLRNTTYKLLRELLAEAQARFPDKYFHVGGDEVDLSCWSSNPELVEYMRRNNLTASGLHALFMRRAIPLLAPGSRPLVWQEVFDEGVPLPNGTIVQMWKSTAEQMIPVLRAGYEVVYSTEWYLDHLESTFTRLLEVDPRAAVERRAGSLIARRIVGGEACMWGEMVDDTNLLSRVWPRASAVAERLWSPALAATVRRWAGWARGWVAAPPERDLRRAEEHVCRMRRRGVPAEPPAGPGYCIL